MKWLKTLVVFIIALGIGGYIYFYEKETPTTEELKEKAKKVFDFKPDDVKRLSLKRGEQLIVCEKKEDKWQMVKPLNVKADKAGIGRILSRLEFLQTERRLKGEKDKKLNLKDFGLDKAKVEVTFEVEDKSFTLLLGDNSSVGRNMYVMRKDKEEVLVVRRSLSDNLDKSLEDLRDRQVIEVDKYGATKLLIQREGKDLECKKEEEAWRITSPILARGARDEIEKILDKLDDLKVAEFISEDAGEIDRFGLSSPELSVTVWEEDVSRSLIFAKVEEDRVYAKREAFDSIYSVEKDIIETLTKKPNELRDRKVVRFDTDKVKRIEVSYADEIILEKEEDEWKIVKPGQIKADKGEVDDFLRELGDLEIEEFVEEDCKRLDRYGLEKPLATVTLILENGEEKQKILLGNKKGSDYCYLKREEEKPVFAVSVDFLQKVERSYLAYINRQILSFSSTDARKLILEREGKRYLCEKDGEDNWKLVEPAGGEIDLSIIDNILWDISTLSAEKFVSESARNLAAYGLGEPQIKLTVEIEGEEGKPAAETLLIGKKSDDGNFYAKLGKRGEIFEIQNSLPLTSQN